MSSFTVKMLVIVLLIKLSIIFYRDISKDDKIFLYYLLNRETLPFRASIRDFDLDPPLTYKGLKDSYHTGE
jgi:hypothetical protein